MTYAIRNSIIIASLVILILAFNSVTRDKTNKKLEVVNISYQQKLNELNTLKRVNPDLAKEKEIMAQHDAMQMKALNRTKFVLKEDNPTLAYDYFTSLAERFCPGLQFDFRVETGGNFLGTDYNSYSLTGKTSLDHYYRFLYHLETQSPLVKIVNKAMSEIDDEIPQSGKTKARIEKKIDFNLRVNVFYEQAGKTYEDLAIRILPAKSVIGNPFRAKIFEPVEDPSQLYYVDINKSKIVGFSSETITVKQEGNGKIAILKTGDKVAYGYLHEINWVQEYALFKINQVGISQDVKLYIEKD
jgi:hypothetical protein